MSRRSTPLRPHLLTLLVLATVGLAGPAPATQPAAAAGFGTDPVEALLPGPLLAVAPIHRADGSTALAALVGPPEPPDEDEEDAEAPGETARDEEPGPRLRSLLLVDPGTGDRTVLAEGLPETARRLATLTRAALSGQGATDLIVVISPAGALLVDPEHSPGGSATADGEAPRALDLGPSLDRAAVLAPATPFAGQGGPLALARPGELTLVSAAGGSPTPVGHFTLPKRARRTRWGVRITSPEVHRVAGDPAAESGPPCWAVGPETYGKRRLRTLLECLGPDGEPQDPIEAWSLLPDGETVTETVYTRYEGRPMLVVLTRQKLGLFVKQRLRAFPLAASRTRVGTEPVLATETVCPIWHDSALGFADTDGDGRDDLYLVCEKGLIDQELRLEIYRGVGPGTGEIGFDPRVRDVELDGEFGSWLFGRDWTGDGLPDLLAVRDGAIEAPSRHRRQAAPGRAPGAGHDRPRSTERGRPHDHRRSERRCERGISGRRPHHPPRRPPHPRRHRPRRRRPPRAPRLPEWQTRRHAGDSLGAVGSALSADPSYRIVRSFGIWSSGTPIARRISRSFSCTSRSFSGPIRTSCFCASDSSWSRGSA